MVASEGPPGMNAGFASCEVLPGDYWLAAAKVGGIMRTKEFFVLF